MNGIEMLTLGIVIMIAMGVVVRGFLRKLEEAREAEPIDAINDPVLRGNLRMIREQKDDIEELRMLLGALETSTIERLKKAKEREYSLIEELLHIKQDFSDLQDLALWMTGCGYSFGSHPYYRANKYLMTIGVAVGSEEVEYSDEEALTILREEVSCPVCSSSTAVGLYKDGDAGDWKLVEGRYCPVCSWKADANPESTVVEYRGFRIKADPFLSGDDMYLETNGGPKPFGVDLAIKTEA